MHDVHEELDVGGTSEPHGPGPDPPSSVAGVAALHTSDEGTQTFTWSPVAELAGMHVRPSVHSLPFGHRGAQYVSPPSCAHAPPAQSSSVTHGGHVTPASPPAPSGPPAGEVASFDEPQPLQPAATPIAVHVASSHSSMVCFMRRGEILPLGAGEARIGGH